MTYFLETFSIEMVYSIFKVKQVSSSQAFWLSFIRIKISSSIHTVFSYEVTVYTLLRDVI